MTPPTPAKVKAQAVAQKLGVVAYMQSQLTVEHLEALAKGAVQYAALKIPGDDDAAKKAYCVEQLDTLLEAFDDKIPVIGAWLDYPVADYLEKWAIGLVVDWAWGALVADGTVRATVPAVITKEPKN